jgi:Fanconi anemia group J protein
MALLCSALAWQSFERARLQQEVLLADFAPSEPTPQDPPELTPPVPTQPQPTQAPDKCSPRVSIQLEEDDDDDFVRPSVLYKTLRKSNSRSSESSKSQSSDHPQTQTVKEQPAKEAQGRTENLLDTSNMPPKKPAGPPKIFFGSRTHQQLVQIVSELKRTGYKPRMVTLGSRAHLCINADVTNKSSPEEW